MESTVTVGIKTLKNKLSEYIREVRRGTRVLITDRDVVVAELREPFTVPAATPEEKLYAQWVREGKIHPPLVKTRNIPKSPIHLPEGTAQRLLDEDRGE